MVYGIENAWKKGLGASKVSLTTSITDVSSGPYGRRVFPSLLSVESFLYDRQEAVKVDDHIGDMLPVHNGTPQGSPVSPIHSVLYSAGVIQEVRDALDPASPSYPGHMWMASPSLQSPHPCWITAESFPKGSRVWCRCLKLHLITFPDVHPSQLASIQFVRSVSEILSSFPKVQVSLEWSSGHAGAIGWERGGRFGVKVVSNFHKQCTLRSPSSKRRRTRISTANGTK